MISIANRFPLTRYLNYLCNIGSCLQITFLPEKILADVDSLLTCSSTTDLRSIFFRLTDLRSWVNFTWNLQTVVSNFQVPSRCEVKDPLVLSVAW